MVLRDGRIETVEPRELVPGDIVEVTAGNKIPADLRMLQSISTTLRIDQSILTGESVSVSKTTQPVEIPDAVTQDKTNMLFAVRLCVFLWPDDDADDAHVCRVPM